MKKSIIIILTGIILIIIGYRYYQNSAVVLNEELIIEKASTMTPEEKLEMEKVLVEQINKEPETSIDEPMNITTASTPIPTKTGTFTETDFIHKGSGEAWLYKDINGSPLLRLENFSVTRGPDLYVYLSKNTNIKQNGLGEFISLGKLKSSKGNQNYPLPENFEDYNSVVIWCKAFGVLFSSADL